MLTTRPPKPSGDPDKLSSTVSEFTNIYGTIKCTVLLTYIAPCEFVGTVKICKSFTMHAMNIMKMTGI